MRSGQASLTAGHARASVRRSRYGALEREATRAAATETTAAQASTLQATRHLHRFTPMLNLARSSLITFAAALVGLLGCSPQKSASPAPADDQYVLVTLLRGPAAAAKPEAERQAIQAAHLANIQRLANEGTLVVAGPFGKVNHDPTQRGIFIFDVRTIDEARALTSTDPAVIAGVLTMDLSRLETNADLRRALAAELAEEAAAKREGRERRMEETIRPYVMVRTERDSTAGAILARALPPGKVVIAGRVDGTRGFYVLDSRDVAEVRGWIGKEYDMLGPVTIDEWYASTLLVQAAAGVAGGPDAGEAVSPAPAGTVG